MLTAGHSLLTASYGELAQLARAPALHAGGHRFDSDILHVGPLFFFGAEGSLTYWEKKYEKIESNNSLKSKKVQ